ncbi:MAG: ThuA domain-containing protein [Planctomycetes bacterium]|nr:ThuA domain-containing protein [Planctomycetota bacterium]
MFRNARLVRCALILGLFGAYATAPKAEATDAPKLRVMFLGDNGHHQPALRFKQLQPVLAERGIALDYTDKVESLKPAHLAEYAAVMIYANQDRWSPEQEAALLDYVRSGRGLVALHCASFCFRSSDAYVNMVGAQFKKHGTGTFRTELAEPNHPLMRGFAGFESFDETYVHAKHNTAGRTVLEYRVDAEGREPWTWVRDEGRGRVFYTAWGHDERTWGNPGFQNLVERGVRWVTHSDVPVPDFAAPAAEYKPNLTAKRTDVAPFEYRQAHVPFYPPGGARKGDGEWNKMQQPLAAEESLKHYITPDDFEVQLFAAEPEIGKPLAMAWDERGRLWICETVDYPNELQSPPTGRDRIRICEDTNGDGRADRFTVFAEQLSIPTSLAFYRGGVIVQDGTETIYLRDTNGDDRADEREVLLTGWALGDTHGGVSNFRYGLDNWYWATQGYNQSSPTRPDGKKLAEFRMGFFRFQMNDRPRQVEQVEFIRSTNNNTWGLGISEEGLIFGSTANGNPSVFMPIPNRYYEQVRGWGPSVLKSIAEDNHFEPVTDQVRQVDHHGGFTAAAGHALYTARTYPQEYWNRTAFVCEPTGHLIATFTLKADGTNFRARNAWNLAASNDEWAAPIMAEVGPDGNVWFIDWYNYIVQHNPTPIGFETGKGNAYQTPLRDKTHGRIYRLVCKSAAKEPAFTLAGATPEQLVAALRHPNMLWRLHAQRLLVERGEDDVVPALLELVKDSSVDEIGLNTGAIHALWTMQGLGIFNVKGLPIPRDIIAVEKALKHPSASVRRTATSVLPSIEWTCHTILHRGLFRDVDPQVRLAAALKAAEVRTNHDGALLAIWLLQDESVLNDPLMIDAVLAVAARHDLPFLLELMEEPGEAELKLKPAALEVVRRVAEHCARLVDSPQPILGPGEWRRNIDLVVAKWLPDLLNARAENSDAIIDGLAAGWPKGRPASEIADANEAFIHLWDRAPQGKRGTLFQLARKLGSKALEERSTELVASLAANVTDEKLPVEQRIAAAQQLIDFRRDDAEVVAKLLGAISPRTPLPLASGLLEAAGRSDSPAVGEKLVANLPVFTPALRTVALRVLLSRADWTRALLTGIEGGQVQLADLSLDQRQSLANHPDKQVKARAQSVLKRGGGLPDPNRQKVLDELLPLAKEKGTVAAGKLVFTKQCAKCHMHRGEGAKIGPDLTGMAVHPKAELLVHIIDPSRSVEGNFRVYSVQMDDGRVFTGLLAGESRSSLELFDAEGKRHVIPREEVEQLAASTKSLMPEGFEKQVTKAEIVDLLEFLADRGQYLPLPLAKAATIVSTRGMFYSEGNMGERLVFDDWGPKTFEGVFFQLIDPQGDRVPNVVMLNSPNGSVSARMPQRVEVPCNTAAKAIHILGGVSGWGHPGGGKEASLIVRLRYADGATEDHALVNGVHLADYIRRIDVPESKFAYDLHGRQVRYLKLQPKRDAVIQTIELVKGKDKTAPIVMAITVEPK